MAIEPNAFLSRAVEMGLLSRERADEVRARLRAAEQAGRRLSVVHVILRLGLLSQEEVDRVVSSLGGAPAEKTVETTGTVRSARAAAGPPPRPPTLSVADLLAGEPPVELGPERRSMPEGSSKYHPVELLGRGGMGEVWLATDRDVRREVAMKTLLPPQDRDTLLRFVVEGQVTGQLEHPNIVPVYDLGVSEADGRPFMVMKRVRGKSLADVLESHRKGPDRPSRRMARVPGSPGTRSGSYRRRASADRTGEPPEKALGRLLDVFLKVCDAVAYAHSRGVIHRDLKPANIMAGEFGEVHVMDWGLAKVLGRPEGHADRLLRTARSDAGAEQPRTMEGAIAGTPNYMPPEQARGEIGRLDERSDVYSLGAVLYEILSLVPPFVGKNALDVVAQVTRGALVPPTERSRAPWPIPRELEAAVLKAMAAAPEDRYPTALELRADIEAYLAGRTLHAARYTPWQVLAKWASRHRAAVIGGAATLAALLVGLVAVLVSTGAARREEAEKIRQSRIESARELFDEARESRGGARTPFNPAAPQEYFLERLPIAVDMGKALQEHPEPPAEWRGELASFAGELQERSEEVADWALAEHLALSAAAWGAVAEEESLSRREHARARREERARADVERFEKILDLIGEAEGETPEQGGLAPGEIPERARQAARLESPGDVAAAVISRVHEDNERLRRRWSLAEGEAFAEPLLSSTQRIFLAETLGRLGDVKTEADGLTAPAVVAGTLLAARELFLSADEVAAWVRAAGALEAIQRGSIPSPGAGSILETIEREYEKAAPISIAVREVKEFWDVTLGDGTLPAVSRESEPRFVSLLARLGDWAAASVTSGSAYTRHLLAVSGPDATRPSSSGVPSPLSIRQQVFVLDQLGLHGDTLPPDVEVSETTAVAILREFLMSPSDGDLKNEALAPGAPVKARNTHARAIAAARNLARLQHGESVELLFQRRMASGEHSVFWQKTAIAMRIAPTPSEEAPETPDGWIRRAVRLEEQGNLRAALEATERAMAEGETAAILSIRGVLLEKLERHQEALALYERAIQLDRLFVPAYANRGTLRLKLGNVPEALADFEEAIRFEPLHAGHYMGRGRARYNGSDFAGAIEDFSRAMELDPASIGGYIARGRARDLAGDPAGAIEDFNIAIELAPEEFAGYNSRGEARAHLGDLTGAIEDFSRAVQLAPYDPAGFYYRGKVRESLGDARGATTDYSRVIQLDPTADAAYLHRGDLRRQGGDLAGALSDFARLVEIRPDWAEAHFQLGLTLQKSNELQRAIEAYSRAILADSRLTKAYHNRGVARQHIGDTKEAIADFTRAIELDSGSADSYLNRANARGKDGDFGGAILDAQRAIEIDPGMWEALVCIGLSRAMSGDREEAARAFAEAARRAPPEAQTRVEAARRRVLGE